MTARRRSRYVPRRGEAYQMRRPLRWLRFVNASGGQMGHYGEKTPTFRAGRGEAVMSLGFQVSDVQKPLAAVWRIAEKGNLVQSMLMN